MAKPADGACDVQGVGMGEGSFGFTPLSILASKPFWLLLIVVLALGFAVLGLFRPAPTQHTADFQRVGAQFQQGGAQFQQGGAKSHDMPLGGAPARRNGVEKIREAPAPRIPIGEEELRRIKNRGGASGEGSEPVPDGEKPR